jgi:hypothetical protein
MYHRQILLVPPAKVLFRTRLPDIVSEEVLGLAAVRRLEHVGWWALGSGWRTMRCPISPNHLLDILNSDRGMSRTNDPCEQLVIVDQLFPVGALLESLDRAVVDVIVADLFLPSGGPRSKIVSLELGEENPDTNVGLLSQCRISAQLL